MKTVTAYRLLSAAVDYPLHIGITEAGTTFAGTVKSAVGLGILLADGIGDTLRVSLTADPVEEIRVGYEILKILGLRQQRSQFRLLPHLRPLSDRSDPRGRRGREEAAGAIKQTITVAVMGCVVNGPGEAGRRTSALPAAKGRGCCSGMARCRKVAGERDGRGAVGRGGQILNKVES